MNRIPSLGSQSNIFPSLDSSTEKGGGTPYHFIIMTATIFVKADAARGTTLESIWDGSTKRLHAKPSTTDAGVVRRNDPNAKNSSNHLKCD